MMTGVQLALVRTSLKDGKVEEALEIIATVENFQFCGNSDRSVEADAQHLMAEQFEASGQIEIIEGDLKAFDELFEQGETDDGKYSS